MKLVDQGATAHIIAFWQDRYARGTGYKPLTLEFLLGRC